jgi:hypothetical protein
MAMARNALPQAARRSQRTTKQRSFRWNQATVRSAWVRGISFLIGRPRGLLVFHPRVGICGRISRVRRR